MRLNMLAMQDGRCFDIHSHSCLFFTFVIMNFVQSNSCFRLSLFLFPNECNSGNLSFVIGYHYLSSFEGRNADNLIFIMGYPSL